MGRPCDLEFRILGPVEVSNGAGALRLGGPKQRALLADLVLHAGATVPTAQLIDDLWGDNPPSTAEHTVETYISRIRRILRDGSVRDVVLTKAPGYLLDVGPERVDAYRFEHCVEAGIGAADRGDDDEASAEFRAALALWRGGALADVLDAPFARAAARRLADRRLFALERRIESDLRLGRARELIAELEALAAAYPYQEPFHGQLMLALYRSGRQSEALAAFRRARTVLVDELGIEPGPDLRKLEQEILRQDPDLKRPPTTRPRLSDQRSAQPGTQRPSRTEPARRGPRRRQTPIAVRLGLAVVIGALLSIGPEGGRAITASAVHANAVVFVDPARSTPLGQADTDGRPAAIAAGFGRVWVTDPTNGRVLVLNPATFRVEDQIPVGRDPTGVAASPNGIWVTDPGSGTVAEINPNSDTVVATVTVATTPSAITVGAGALWVTDASDGTLTRIDPDRASVVDTIAVGQPLTDVSVGLGSVWVTGGSSGQLIEIDPRTDKVTGTVAIGNGPASVRVTAGAVWVANPPDNTVSRFDPTTGAVDKLSVSNPTALAGAVGALWVASSGNAALTRIDLAADEIASTTPLANPATAMVDVGETLALVTLATPATHRGGTLRVVAGDGVDGIDPGAAYSASAWQLLSMTNDSLLTYARTSHPGGVELVPDLATALPLVQDGGRTFTFKLRRGVYYSNGMVVRPEDFRRAVEREYKAGTGLAALGVPLVGAQRCLSRHIHCTLDSGVTVDDFTRTVTYHLSAPDPAFLYQLALPFGAPVPGGTPDIGPATGPLPATGPYLIADYLSGRRVNLVRNPRFHPWSATARPDGFPTQITVRLGLRPAEQTAAVTAGRADVMLDSPPAAALADLRRTMPQQMHTYSLATTYALFVNTRAAPFNRITARRALTLAVDRSRVVQLAGGQDLARATCQILPPQFPGYYPYCSSTIHPGPDGLWHGPALSQAHALIAASGTSGTSVTVSTVAQDPLKLAVGRYLVGLLDALGYRAHLRTYPDDHSYYRQVGLGKTRSQVGFFGWQADYQAGSAFFEPLFGCAAYKPDQPYNMNPAGFCDRQIDREIVHATVLQTTNAAAANRAWQHIDREIMQQVPWISLVNPVGIDLVSATVGNYQRTTALGVLLDQLWVVNH